MTITLTLLAFAFGYTLATLITDRQYRDTMHTATDVPTPVPASVSMRGKHTRTPEHRANISDSMRKTWTPERRAKHSEAQKNAWARRKQNETTTPTQ
jgi:hypothetical protein